MANFGYHNNPNLPRLDYKHNFTQHGRKHSEETKIKMKIAWEKRRL